MTNLQKEQVEKYRIAGLGYSAIAKEMGLSRETVKSHCVRHEVGKKADKKPSQKTGRCKNCGAAVVQLPHAKEKKFCSDKCRNAWWNAHLDQVTRKAWYRFTCKHCGKTLEVYGNADRKYCCHECYILDRFGNPNVTEEKLYV